MCAMDCHQHTPSYLALSIFVEKDLSMKTPASSEQKATRMHIVLPLCALLLLAMLGLQPSGHATAASSSTAEQAFTQASQESGVPVEVLKALCQMEGHMSMHAGQPSVSEGYGCMNLVHTATTDGCKALAENRGDVCTHHFTRKQIDTLGHAAQLLGVSSDQIKSDFATNIRAGAAILHEQAIAHSSTHTLPTQLPDWYDAVAAYSNATVPSTATMYADAAFKLIQSGFTATTDSGETITLAPQSVAPKHTNLSVSASATSSSSLPAGCTTAKAEYAPAINCILDQKTHDCNTTADNQPCNYESANRPQDLDISRIVIHDIEGSAQAALATFQDATSAVSTHYIVDTDGTVYQVLRNEDIGYQAGNYWYNQHSIGIEHTGFDATGYQWYNATQYLASAKLVAYLINQYHIPFNHDYIVSHGTIPSPTLGTSPNHVDPGPYWLWEYYGKLIAQQHVPLPPVSRHAGLVTLLPPTGRKPFGPNGTETQDNFNFFSLYTGPSTTSGLIPHTGNTSDITDETTNVETAISYYYSDRKLDEAGTGKIMYKIWYGELDQPDATPPNNQYAHAKQAWLAVPAGSAIEGIGSGNVVSLNQQGASVAPIYGRPLTQAAGYQKDQIGEAPTGALFVSAATATITEDDGTHTEWSEINFNHRQAWVPTSEVTKA
jgi:N-acetyl-anhydromuramyl-L-alanine amidase AmpD